MWSTDTFSHVCRATDALQARVAALQQLLALGPDAADPETVHDAGTAIEDAMEGFWAPVVWDAQTLDFGDDS